MAVRLGTQNWINPAPFAAAAEMVVDAGRATGAGIAAIGAGIGQGLQNRQARQERAQNRQDALDQRSFENARALRAEERAVKQSKLAASESILAAKKMNLDMASKMYESVGTPEAEAAMLKAQRDFQEANNWYQVSVGNNADIQPPQGGVTDYLGVGGATVPGGWPVGQSPSEKAARGEPTGAPDVYWNKQDYAESDAAQAGAGMATPSAQPSMEAAAELTTAAGLMDLARRKEVEATRIQGRRKGVVPEAEALRTEAKFLAAQAQMKRNDEVSAREAAERRAEDERSLAAKRAENEAAVAEFQKYADANKLTANDGSPLKFPPNIPAQTAAQIIRDRDITDPNRDASFKQRSELNDQRFAQSKDRIAFAAQFKADAAAEARAAGVPEDKVNAIYKEIEVLSDEEDNLRAAAKDMAANGMMAQSKLSMERADTVRTRIQGKLKEMKEWRDSIGAGAKPAATGASAAPTVDPAAAERLKRVFGR